MPRNKIKKIQSDLQELSQDVREEAEYLAEEAGAAEFMTAHEMVEDFGIVMAAGERFNEIAREQLRYGVEDVLATLRELTEQPSAAVLGHHYQRRVEHILEGIMKAQATVLEEQAKLLETHQTIWRAFFGSLEASRHQS